MSLEKFFYPTPKNWALEKRQIPTHRQSEVRKFETDQHSDKQKLYLSSTTNALNNGTKLGVSPQGF